jgi:predicted DNA-binding transcriptional regulator AlpA
MQSPAIWSDPMSIEDNSQTPNASAPTEPDDDELWDSRKVRAYFGGSKPLHSSTVYRGVATGIYPPPINVSPNVVRWLPRECRAARQRMIAARHEPKLPSRRGRNRRQGDEPPMKPRPRPTR